LRSDAGAEVGHLHGRVRLLRRHVQQLRAHPGRRHHRAGGRVRPGVPAPAGDAHVRDPEAAREGPARGPHPVTADELAGTLRSRFADVVSARGEVTVSLVPGEVREALEWLRDEPAVSFGLLSDLTCTDWPGRSPRYWVTLHLRSAERRHRV